MAQYIDKSTLVAEIEKLKAYLQIPNAQLEAIKVCDNVISVIDTLEVKEVDLEKEIGKYLDANDIEFGHQIKLFDIAKHFFELGLKAQKGE